ncbi:MAG: Bug family tripartite tricarboxylate transporter substrate binding protein [Arenicella sp.]
MFLLPSVFSVAQTSTVDFSGETVEWIIPFEAGGGSDKWARFYAPLLSEALPGKPLVKVRNVLGGGSTNGANEFAEKAKPDGLTLFGSSGSTQFPYILGDSRVRYDYKDWNILLATPTGGVIYVAAQTNVKVAADLKQLKETLVYGSIGVTSLDLVHLLAFDMLDMDIEVIFGRRGRSSSRKAFEKGEATIDYQTSSAYLANVMPLVEQGKAIPIMSLGVLDNKGDVVRDPTFPELPSFPEVYEQIHGEKVSGTAWDVWKTLFSAGYSAQKMLFLPKDTPQEIITAYSNAVTDITRQPGFAESYTTHLGVYEQKTGVDAEVALRESINVDEHARKWIKGWLQEKYQVTLN